MNGPAAAISGHDRHTFPVKTACVSVTDNGRSFSPDCLKSDINYRTLICKAEGNRGVRGAISFENEGILDGRLMVIWAVISALLLGLIGVSGLFSKLVVDAFSREVAALSLGEANDFHASGSRPWLSRVARFLMEKAGISSSLSEKASLLHARMRAYEASLREGASSRARLEQEAISSRAYLDKVSQIRHDIRSPLSSLQAIYERLKSDDVSTTKALATAIRRIQILFDDLSGVDHAPENPKLVIAEVVVEELALLISEKARRIKSASVHVDYKQEMLSPVLVGEKEFQSAIENPLENAFDAISVGGAIKLRIEQDGGRCQISVEDNGCGISPENRERLFTRGGSFGKVNGGGLGLHNTKRSVESWGGSITCTLLSRGTRFTIDLPVMQTGVVFTGLPAAKRLKVIDDDHLVSATLAAAGFQIVARALTYQDGKRLLDQGAAEGIPVLVDQQLGGNYLGTDLIAELPVRHGIFLCTNDFADLGVVKLAREIGVKVIPKPLCFFRQPAATIAQ